MTEIGPTIKITDRALIKVPPHLRRVTLLAALLGGATSGAMRDRLIQKKRGPAGRPMGPFHRSGGMWRGMETRRGRHGQSSTKFYRSSFSSKFGIRHAARLAEEEERKRQRAERRAAGSTGAKSASNAKSARKAKSATAGSRPRSRSTGTPDPSKPKTWAQQKKAARVRNRVKAESSQNSKSSAKWRRRKDGTERSAPSVAADGRNILEPTPEEAAAVMSWLAASLNRSMLTHPDAKPGKTRRSGDPTLRARLDRLVIR